MTDVHPVFFAAGVVMGMSPLALVPLGVLGLAFKPRPEAWRRVVIAVAAILLAATSVCLWAIGSEAMSALMSESIYERSQFRYRTTGEHAWVFWTMLAAAMSPMVLVFRFGRHPVSLLTLAAVQVAEGWIMRPLSAIGA